MQRKPLDALAALGGFEIAMMCGAMLEAAAQKRVVVVDGFISSSAVLVAHAMQPRHAVMLRLCTPVR
jgi:nicotinate-nucleotide--dimethylbenzimidazole phosphoribosyltransferase